MIADMPRPRPPRLWKQTTRHGKVAWYVCQDRKRRVRIKGEYGSDEFMANYRAAMAGDVAPENKQTTKSGTLRWLADQWLNSRAYLETKPSTQKQRENILKRVLALSGDQPFTRVNRASIEAGLMDRKATPFAADNWLKVMRGLFDWAKSAGHVRENPTADVKFLNHDTDGFPPWTVDDVEKFRATWPLGTQQRLALEILFTTGLRRGDAVRLGRQHVRDGVATLRAEKTGTELFVPITQPLQAALDAVGETGNLTYLATEYGRPRTKEGFGAWFREACDRAGVAGSAHGLRKLRTVLLIEHGASERELMAAMGWTTPAMVGLYGRSADRRRLALAAAERTSPEQSMLSPMGEVRAKTKKHQ